MRPSHRRARRHLPLRRARALRRDRRERRVVAGDEGGCVRTRNAMTQSEVPRRGKSGRADEVRAGALSIGAFERSRWRLRRMRPLWVLN
jgi:hypothetical protein